MANILKREKQIAIVGSLAEGSSIRSIERLTGVHRDTIMRLGIRIGQGCERILDSTMRNLHCEHLQLEKDWGVASDLWGCPSFTELGRDWTAVHRSNLLNPTATPVLSHVEKCLKDTTGPVIAATDYVRLFAEQVRPAIQHMGRRYEVLGTDGFGRSDTREKLRDFFEVDRRWVVLTALRSLADAGQFDRQKLAEAIAKYGIDTTKPNPMTV